MCRREGGRERTGEATKDEMLPGTQLADLPSALERFAQALVQRKLNRDVRHVPQQRRQQAVVQARHALGRHNAARPLQGA